MLTVTDVSTSCAVVIFRVKVSCITSVEGIILWYYALVSEVPPDVQYSHVYSRCRNRVRVDVGLSVEK